MKHKILFFFHLLYKKNSVKIKTKNEKNKNLIYKNF
jgi:hypothetical protein